MIDFEGMVKDMEGMVKDMEGMMNELDKMFSNLFGDEESGETNLFKDSNLFKDMVGTMNELDDKVNAVMEERQIKSKINTLIYEIGWLSYELARTDANGAKEKEKLEELYDQVDDLIAAKKKIEESKECLRCIKCGKECKEDDIFCCNCGAKIKK